MQIVHNRSPETTNYLRKGEGEGGGVRDYAPPVNSSEFLVDFEFGKKIPYIVLYFTAFY